MNIMASTHIHIRDYRTEIPGALSEDHMEWVFPTIESVNSHGKETVWVIRVRLAKVGTESFVVIKDEYFDSRPLGPNLVGWHKVDSGLKGRPPRKTVATTVAAGKNIDSTAATNVWTQALRNALGIYNKQRKKATGPQENALADGAEALTLYPPMLAKLFSDMKTTPVINEALPAYVQRKYNGVRAVATMGGDGGVVMYSRRKNVYPGFEYIKVELRIVLGADKRVYLDGELYKHGVALQDISGYARREDQEGDMKLNYMVYDCFIPSEPGLLFSERMKILDGMLPTTRDDTLFVKRVETFTVTSRKEIDGLYEGFLKEGFEGAMLRLNDVYHYSYNDHRSSTLLKFKPVRDHEYVVVDYKTGDKGKAAAALMIVCETESGQRFPVTPAMELPERIAMAAKMGVVEPNGHTHFENHWKGYKIIVTFDELSTGGLPQRARTKMEKRLWD